MYREHVLHKVYEQRLLHDVSLELTYNCNLDCFFCYNDRGKKGQPLSLLQYQSLLQDLARMQTLFVTLTGGEPMVHPHFFDIGSAANKLGFVVRVRTNGHSLGANNCLRLKNEIDPYLVEVSLHGASASTHDQQTRVDGSFTRLLTNLEHARHAGLRCTLVTTPTAWNEGEIDAMFALSDELQIPLRFQGPVAPRDNGDVTPMQIQPSPTAWEHIDRLLLERIASEPESVTLNNNLMPQDKNKEKSLCGVGVSGVDIDPFGNVLACMHLQEAAGNIQQRTIQEIWEHSPLFKRARERSVAAAQRFEHEAPNQYGAPLFCIAVEENVEKSACQQCSTGCK